MSRIILTVSTRASFVTSWAGDGSHFESFSRSGLPSCYLFAIMDYHSLLSTLRNQESTSEAWHGYTCG